MRLKSLELIGFKSFVDRTVINFEEGVTVIVGPNGCGKSNIVDAIRWVMGEQSAKHLRGASMGDVIFNGTESRPPMGMASVFLTFDNSDGRAPVEYADYSEITVGRRLYRSGESEYYINKTPCRLRDIIDLFLGTGVGTRAYAIVEQGMIDQILSAKPEERRMLIEEAAGISKFKARKEAAERRMEATKANLARLSDILGELEKQMGSLYRQAKKAERFKIYSDELASLELTVSAHQYNEAKDELDRMRGDLERIKESEVVGKSKLAEEEAGIEMSRMCLSELEAELDGVQEAIYERQNELQLLEAEISYKTKEFHGLMAEIDRWKLEADDFSEKISAWSNELEVVNVEKVGADVSALLAEELFTAVDADISRLRDKHHELIVSLEDGRRRLFECVEKVSSLGSHLEQLKRRESELAGWIAKDQTEIDRIDELIEEIEGKASVRSGDVDGTKQLQLEMRSELIAAYDRLKKQEEELDRADVRIAALKEDLSNKRSRLQSLGELHKNYEGYKEGVRAVLKRREEVEEFRGIVGTINDVVETHPKYENAVGAILGDKLQYVVVKSHQVGVHAIDYLKTEVSGRSTFVPMELRSQETSSADVAGKGVIGPLVDYVSCSDDYKKIVNYLFKDVILVGDLQSALDIWDKNGSSCTLVTLDGEVVEPSGVVSGGFGPDISKQLMEHRREMKELSEAVQNLSSELAIEEQIRASLKERIDGLQKNIDKLENEFHSEEIKLVNQEKDLHHLESELNYQRVTRDKLTLEVAAIAEELASIKREKEASESVYKKSLEEKAELEKVVANNQAAETALRERLDSMIRRCVELNLKMTTEMDKAASKTREIDRLTSEIAAAQAGVAEREALIAGAKAIVGNLEFGINCKQAYLACLIENISNLKKKQSAVKVRFDAELAAVREKEAAVKHLRRSHDEQVKSMHEMELACTQKDEKIGYMCREIFEKYRVSLETSYSDYLSGDIDLTSSAKRVEELRDKLRKIGPVNVDAIKEYDEIKTRYDFLKGQHGDLITSINDLTKAVQKINKTSRVRFIEAFESVNERFQKLFPKLFEGGKARLVLVDDQNVLDSGVDIIVQPPGKKLQNISLLSGGEKALTAVALIFALFLHHPSPFCLLDEVDAPLDDANIDRFNELIREMTRLSQFILITHNKRTMELSDILYGVTMEEKGVSKVISLAIADRKEAIHAA